MHFMLKTGDLKNINNYRNSYNFLKAVKEARKWQPDLDTLVIFAGACQSNYEALMESWEQIMQVHREE